MTEQGQAVPTKAAKTWKKYSLCNMPRVRVPVLPQAMSSSENLSFGSWHSVIKQQTWVFIYCTYLLFHVICERHYERSWVFSLKHFVLLQCDKFNLWIRSDEAKCNWFIWRKNYSTKYLNEYVLKKKINDNYLDYWIFTWFQDKQTGKPSSYASIESLTHQPV